MKKLLSMCIVGMLLISAVPVQGAENVVINVNANLAVGIDISLIDGSIAIGDIALNTTYGTWSVWNPDVELVGESQSITNNSSPSIPVDLAVSSTDPTNGSTSWALSDTVGTNGLDILSIRGKNITFGEESGEIAVDNTPVSFGGINTVGTIHFEFLTPTDSSGAGTFNFAITILATI